jgi:hypothetical protein
LAEIDIVGQLGNTFGFSKWFPMGLGDIGTLLLWLFFILIIGGGIGGGVIYYFLRKSYKHKIEVIGIVGNQPMDKWSDRAKKVPMGKAGDYLFWLRKSKRYLPPPTIQSGVNKWRYWEREDGELINIGYDNVDLIQKKMGVKFVDTDMRMSRLGIEKNLQYRLQKQSFWEKYGQTILQIVFYVVVGLMMIVMFLQFQKTAESLDAAVKTSGEVMEKVIAYERGTTPITPGTSGTIPAIIGLMILGNKKWKRKN